MMNIDEFKSAWKNIDERLNSTQPIDGQLIESMIRERSNSRLSRIIKKQFVAILYVFLMFGLGVAILTGNPFDYQTKLEHIPIVIYCLSMATLLVGMVNAYRKLKIVDLNRGNLSESLKQIVRLYENPDRYLGYALRTLIFSAAVLFPLSFFPRKISGMDISNAMIDTVLPIFITSSLLFIAYKFGVFREKNSQKFRRELEELQSLKGLSEELDN